MSYGVSSSGFIRKTYDQIRSGIFKRLSEFWGPIDTSETGNIGQINRVFAQDIDIVWDNMERNYLNLDVDSCSGVIQDNLFALNYLHRKPASKAFVTAICYGDQGTVLTIDTHKAGNSITGDVFVVSETTSISDQKAQEVVVNFERTGTDTYGQRIRITLANGQIIDVATSASASTILQDHVETSGNGIRNNSSGALDTEAYLNPENENSWLLKIKTTDPTNFFKIEYLEITGTDFSVTTESAGSPVPFEAEVEGQKIAQIGTINQIITGVAGWYSVINLVSADMGRDIETDAEFRNRRAYSFTSPSGTTVFGLRNRIYEQVPGISYCKVYTNRTDGTDMFGHPPHSFHVVVEGGNDKIIANSIEGSMPVGIVNYGRTEVNATSGSLIRFSRPIIRYGWVKVTINKKNREENYPADGAVKIQNAVRDFMYNISGVGVDVIAQKAYRPIYSTVNGLEDVDIEVAVTSETFGTSVDPGTPVGSQETVGEYSSGWQTSSVAVHPMVRVEWRDALQDAQRVRIIVVDNDQ